LHIKITTNSDKKILRNLNTVKNQVFQLKGEDANNPDIAYCCLCLKDDGLSIDRIKFRDDKPYDADNDTPCEDELFWAVSGQEGFPHERNEGGLPL